MYLLTISSSFLRPAGFNWLPVESLKKQAFDLDSRYIAMFCVKKQRRQWISYLPVGTYDLRYAWTQKS